LHRPQTPSPRLCADGTLRRIGRRSGDASLGVIAISFTPPPAAGSLPSLEQIVATRNLNTPSKLRQGQGQLIFRASGAAPIAGMDPVHWRGTALVGSHVMDITYFDPTGGRVVTDEGCAILQQLIGRTRATTGAQ